MQRITSAQNQKYRDALRLHSSRCRKKQRRFIVFGKREIERAVAQDRFSPREVYIHEDFAGIDSADQSNAGDGAISDDDNSLKEIIADGDAQVVLLSAALFEKLNYGDRHDSMIAVFDLPESARDEALTFLSVQDGDFIVVLEGIENPGNLGAVIRSADGAGAAAVILADCQTGPFHPNAIRNSVGTVFSMPVAEADSLSARDWLVSKGIRPYAAIVDQAHSIYDVDLTGRCAIVFGNEATGLSDIWRSKDCSPVSLPMLGIADSLNVAVSASVMIYEARRQRIRRDKGV